MTNSILKDSDNGVLHLEESCFERCDWLWTLCFLRVPTQ